ncbi:uncharacterized protein LOC143041065 [Oratosquilla oratoria]|uniref:uncharacterized protein LOC143041065 n=1 Tax=Oratosquilla oratoria TaxID=337810 RepID=UPI003F768483
MVCYVNRFSKMSFREQANFLLLRIILATLTCLDSTIQHNHNRNGVTYNPFKDTEIMKHENIRAFGENSAAKLHFQNHHNRGYNELSTNEAILRLHSMLTTIETTCRKLVRVGGRSCRRIYDGAKMLCMDEDVASPPNDCLTYSFGVGYDFSFDEHMQDFGCEVHAFDHDESHEKYEHLIGPSVFYHKMRIGEKSRYIKNCKKLDTKEKTCESHIRYRTMTDLRKELNHEDRRLFYLKMDIEGEEWKVLPQVLDQTRVLHDTTQLSLEIHLNMLLERNETIKRALVLDALGVMTSLHNLGFRLVFYETNELGPATAKVGNVLIDIFAEILLLKRA